MHYPHIKPKKTFLCCRCVTYENHLCTFTKYLEL